jgi:hypothetical protein
LSSQVSHFTLNVNLGMAEETLEVDDKRLLKASLQLETSVLDLN